MELSKPTTSQDFMPQEEKEAWFIKEYEETLKRAILRVGDNCPASQYLAESAIEFIHKVAQKTERQTVEKCVEIIKKNELREVCKMLLDSLSPEANKEEHNG